MASDTSDKPRKKRQELAHFYGTNESAEQFTDINSKKFDSELYVKTVIKENNLKQLLEEESSLVNNIQRLDSECQTLVYDHYDKFIAATDIVRKMKEGSVEMNAQVMELKDKMEKITSSSENISKDLEDRRGKLSNLLGIHSTLKKLQFLFQLPKKIGECIKEKKFSEGVKSYVETAEVLSKYQHLPSFAAIHKDCQSALKKLNAALKNELDLNEGSAQHLTLCVDLLLQLGEPAEGLCDNFLVQARAKLEADLSYLRSLGKGKDQEKSSDQACRVAGSKRSSVGDDQEEVEEDILQFIDVCHDTFVANLWLVISSYKEMFVRNEDTRGHRDVQSGREDVASKKLKDFVLGLLGEYILVVEERVAAEEDQNLEYNVLSTALDKFHRRLHAIGQLMSNADFNEKSLHLIYKAAKKRCEASFDWLKENFLSHLTDVRQTLVSPKMVSQDNSVSNQMNELLTHLVASTASDIKARVVTLMAFVEPKHTFAMQSDFRHQFTRNFVREGVVVAFFNFISDSLQEFCLKKEKDPVLVLILSRMCLDLHTSTVHYLLNHCDEQLQLEDKRGLTPYSKITSSMKETGQALLDHYVSYQGAAISQMLRRSIELKDWLGCGEPRTVRRVMRTVRDELASIDVSVGALYEEGVRKDRSSDSSRRTFHSISRMGPGTRSNAWSGGYSSGLDQSFAGNLSKLWSERIEIFAPVDFTRMSILTGIIKISLKTVLECIRLQTFGRFGFQQVQVDIHYLRTYLWPYVADEQILNVLLDEVLTSASLRSTEVDIMEMKVVEFICEQN